MQDVSATIGEFLLKGWVLTDSPCPTCMVPLMRSPAGSSSIREFCPACDPQAPPPNHDKLTNDQVSSGAVPTTMKLSNTADASAQNDVRADAAGVPFEATSARAPSDETKASRMREQSQQASSEIAKRVLKGWAMLGDECPSPTCFGVPLVRRPKRNGGRDPRMECVICGTVYVNEKDAASFGSNVGYARNNGEAPAGLDAPELTDEPPTSLASLPHSPQTDSRDTTSTLPEHSPSTQQLSTTSTTLTALSPASRSLELALHILSDRMKQLTQCPEMVDTGAIASTSEAIAKVTRALGEVKHLIWFESQADRTNN